MLNPQQAFVANSSLTVFGKYFETIKFRARVSTVLPKQIRIARMSYVTEKL